MKVKELLQKKTYISGGYCFIVVNDGSTLEKLKKIRVIITDIYRKKDK